MKKRPFISIVVASYNRKYIINETISSLLNQDYDPERFEIILVDNNSSDGTISEVVDKFKNEITSSRLKLVPLKYNSGSSGSYSEALPHMNEEWAYMLKMDEDLILDKKCLSSLVEEAEKSESHGITGGKVYFYKERTKFHAIGSKLSHWYAIAKGIGVNEVDEGQYNSPMSLDALNGCMILISKRILNKVGWFDTDYFLYYDDHDLMFKSKQKGFEHRYTPNAVGYHDTSTGSKKKYSNKLWLYYSARGSLLFLKKNFSPWSYKFYIYFLMHNVKFLAGIFYILTLSNKANIKENLSISFKGYSHGLNNKVGYYDIDSSGINVVLFSGGRGSGSLSNGLREYARKNNINIKVIHITNAYDDGKSTGEIRKFYGSSILGPSDVRKIQANQFNFFFKDSDIKKFLSLRLDGEREEILKELKLISEQNKPTTDYVYSNFLKLPFILKKEILKALRHFFTKNYEHISLEDFAFSNLIYGSLADLYGGLQHSEEIIRKAINLPDPVILNSVENGYLYALTEDGHLLHDEASIVDYTGISPIYEVYYSFKELGKTEKENFQHLTSFEEKKFLLESYATSFPPLSEQAINSLLEADIVIYGPGTQYSSLYPTYFSDGIAKLLTKLRALKVFITNINHDNETPGFSAIDQIRQAVFYFNQKGKTDFSVEDLIEVVISNDPKQQDPVYIVPNRTELEQLKLNNILIQNVESKNTPGAHNPEEISNLIFNAFNSRWK